MCIDIYSHNTYFAIVYCPAASFYLHFLYLVLIIQIFYNVLRPSAFDHFYTLYIYFECIFLYNNLGTSYPTILTFCLYSSSCIISRMMTYVRVRN